MRKSNGHEIKAFKNISNHGKSQRKLLREQYKGDER